VIPVMINKRMILFLMSFPIEWISKRNL
jgi:hypothetical protein